MNVAVNRMKITVHRDNSAEDFQVRTDDSKTDDSKTHSCVVDQCSSKRDRNNSGQTNADDAATITEVTASLQASKSDTAALSGQVKDLQRSLTAFQQAPVTEAPAEEAKEEPSPEAVAPAEENKEEVPAAEAPPAEVPAEENKEAPATEVKEQAAAAEELKKEEVHVSAALTGLVTRKSSDRFLAIALLPLSMLIMCYTVGILAMGTDNETALCFGGYGMMFVTLIVASAVFPDGPSSTEKPFLMGYLYFNASLAFILAINRLSSFADQPYPVMVIRRTFAVVLSFFSIGAAIFTRSYDGSYFWTIARTVYGGSSIFRLTTVGLLYLFTDAKVYPPGILSFRIAVLSACLHGSVSIIFTTRNRHCIARCYDRVSQLLQPHIAGTINSTVASLRAEFIPNKDRNTRRPQSRFLSYPGSDSWQWYNNDGAYNVFADKCPIENRVGPWAPLSVPLLICVQIAAVVYMPALEDPGLNLTVPPARSNYWWLDFSLGCWGLVMTSVCYYRQGAGMQQFAYTCWSWNILTARNLMAALCAVQAVRDCGIGGLLAFVTEALRFPAIVGTAAIFVLWNFVVVPTGILWYFKEDRMKFINIITTFPNINMHSLNGVMILVSCAFGGPGNGVRLLGPADLWMGFLVLDCYMLVYLFYLDRIGVHLYFAFSPRTKLFAPLFILVLGVYVGSYQGWNMVVLYLTKAVPADAAI